MLEKHREKKAEEHYTQELAQWQELRDSTEQLLDLARHFNGDPSGRVILKGGETVFATVTGAGLIEDRRGAGHWEGRSSGVSIPIGSIGGRSVRYHVGVSRGHYVQGSPVATAVDTGTVVVTNQRVVFQGTRQTRECLFAKLIGFEHSDDGSTAFSVSNRQKPTRVHYGTKIAGWFDFRLDLALAHYHGSVDEMVDGLEKDLASIDAARPQAPPGPPQPAGRGTPTSTGAPGAAADSAASHPAPSPHTAEPAATSPAHPGPRTPSATRQTPIQPAGPVTSPLPPANWYPDPTGQERLRWWDGQRWSSFTAQ